MYELTYSKQLEGAFKAPRLGTRHFAGLGGLTEDAIEFVNRLPAHIRGWLEGKSKDDLIADTIITRNNGIATQHAAMRAAAEGRITIERREWLWVEALNSMRSAQEMYARLTGGGLMPSPPSGLGGWPAIIIAIAVALVGAGITVQMMSQYYEHRERAEVFKGLTEALNAGRITPQQYEAMLKTYLETGENPLKKLGKAAGSGLETAAAILAVGVVAYLLAPTIMDIFKKKPATV